MIVSNAFSTCSFFCDKGLIQGRIVLPSLQEAPKQVPVRVDQNLPLLSRDLIVETPLRELVGFFESSLQGTDLGGVLVIGLRSLFHEGQRLDFEGGRLLVRRRIELGDGGPARRQCCRDEREKGDEMQETHGTPGERARSIHGKTFGESRNSCGL